jgi:predicted nucleotidyltransferase
MVTLESLRTRDRRDIEALASRHGASNIRVFGSVAKGGTAKTAMSTFL